LEEKLILLKGKLCHVSEGAGSAWKLQVSISGLCMKQGKQLQKKNGLLNSWWIHASSAVKVL
jgi:hypothetical protein